MSFFFFCFCFFLCVFFFFFFFFFSSRRRHTRSLRDWSSDVCSSDLGLGRSVIAISSRNADATISACGLARSEEHTSELQSRRDLVCRLLLEKTKEKKNNQFAYKKKSEYNLKK